jgi:hypothetical protein
MDIERIQQKAREVHIREWKKSNTTHAMALDIAVLAALDGYKQQTTGVLTDEQVEAGAKAALEMKTAIPWETTGSATRRAWRDSVRAAAPHVQYTAPPPETIMPLTDVQWDAPQKMYGKHGHVASEVDREPEYPMCAHVRYIPRNDGDGLVCDACGQEKPSAPAPARVESTATREPPQAARVFHLQFVSNGEEVDVDCSQDEQMTDVVQRALSLSDNTGRPASDWEIRNRVGVLLEQRRSVRDLGFKSGERVFLSLSVGFGGSSNTQTESTAPVQDAQVVREMYEAWRAYTGDTRSSMIAALAVARKHESERWQKAITDECVASDIGVRWDKFLHGVMERLTPQPPEDKRVQRIVVKSLANSRWEVYDSENPNDPHYWAETQGHAELLRDGMVARIAALDALGEGK